jgi:hypothetical protein
MTDERADQIVAELLRNCGLDPGPESAGDAALSSLPPWVPKPPPSPIRIHREGERQENPYLAAKARPAPPPPRQEPAFNALTGREVEEIGQLLQLAARAGPGAAHSWEARYATVVGEARRLLRDMKAALGATGAPPVV